MNDKFQDGASTDDLNANPRAIDLAAGRRAFMRSVGLGAAGAAILGASAGVPTAAMAQSADIDVEILNFALNLEYLEAEFYLQAAFGRNLADNDITGKGFLGGVKGGRKVDFQDPIVRAYAHEIANDEEAHVKTLRAALGPAKVAGRRSTSAKASLLRLVPPA